MALTFQVLVNAAAYAWHLLSPLSEALHSFPHILCESWKRQQALYCS